MESVYCRPEVGIARKLNVSVFCFLLAKFWNFNFDKIGLRCSTRYLIFSVCRRDVFLSIEKHREMTANLTEFDNSLSRERERERRFSSLRKKLTTWLYEAAFSSFKIFYVDSSATCSIYSIYLYFSCDFTSAGYFFNESSSAVVHEYSAAKMRHYNLVQ